MFDQKAADAESIENSSSKKTVRVWDLPTRVFHWTLLVLFAVAWISHEAEGALFEVHIISGICVLGMVVFRLIWGIIGSRHALFADFVKGWPTVRAYGKSLLSFKPPYHVGHNPVGGWMIVGLLLMLAFTALNGLFVSDDGYVGPLAGLISPGLSHAMGEFHEGTAVFLLFLVGFHIVGVVVHGLMSGENLPRAMWTGDKNIPAGIEASSIASVGWWRVVVAVCLSLAAVWSFF
ncbi:MAG: hypothetical protein HOM66_00695 [Rhodospirillales bacterium]|nr:hypothetical protein [Rhodospirillales bacterium]